MRLKTSFRALASPNVAFSYLEDFGRIEEWDPFIRRAERLTQGPPRVGSVYRLAPKFGPFRLRYEVTDLDPVARRIRLIGSARGFRGWDEITVNPDPLNGPGSVVTYEAEIALHGRARLLYLLAPLGIVAILLTGGNAMRGLRRRLDTSARVPAAEVPPPPAAEPRPPADPPPGPDPSPGEA
ncbi:MAG: SRPBCC family protein [Candidatus Limnocylindrales bacterium]